MAHAALVKSTHTIAPAGPLESLLSHVAATACYNTRRQRLSCSRTLLHDVTCHKVPTVAYNKYRWCTGGIWTRWTCISRHRDCLRRRRNHRQAHCRWPSRGRSASPSGRTVRLVRLPCDVCVFVCVCARACAHVSTQCYHWCASAVTEGIFKLAHLCSSSLQAR